MVEIKYSNSFFHPTTPSFLLSLFLFLLAKRVSSCRNIHQRVLLHNTSIVYPVKPHMRLSVVLQMVKFPHNYFATMILTGGKGSRVNISQIVSLLGQQELEGKRVPRMSSGKTLPRYAYPPLFYVSCVCVGLRACLTRTLLIPRSSVSHSASRIWCCFPAR